MRKIKRTYNQTQVRVWLSKHHGINCEAFVKYVYDGYTLRAGYRAIRKQKMRAKVKHNFREAKHDYRDARHLVDVLVRSDNEQ